MRAIRRIVSSATRLAALAVVLLGGIIAAPAAFAAQVPPPGNVGGSSPAGSVAVHTVTVGGTPGWQIALFMAGAAVLAAAIAVLLDRMRPARRRELAVSAR